MDREGDTGDRAACSDAWELKKDRRKHWVSPKWDRTRTVNLVRRKNADNLIICSCQFPARWGLPCRHILKVLGRKPVKEDCHVRWWHEHEYLTMGRENTSDNVKE